MKTPQIRVSTPRRLAVSGPGRTFSLSCFAAAALGLAALLGSGGCATAPTASGSKPSGSKYVFFPGPPDPPRLQFLTALGSEKELRGGKGGGLLSYVTGVKPEDNPLGKPYGATFKHNLLYLADTSYRAVMMMDFAQKKMRALSPEGEGSFKMPLNIAVDDDDVRYVADSGRQRVIIVDAAGRYAGALGDREHMEPRDVVVTKDKLYVADHVGPAVRVYDRATRQKLLDVPNAEDAKSNDRKIFQPNNIAVDAQGRIYVGDTGAFRVQVYGADGKFQRSVGHYGDNPGEFMRVKGVAVDRDSRLYVVDAATQEVQIFNEQGQLLMWFGDPGDRDTGLNLPAKVVVDYDHVDLFRQYAAPNFEIEYLVIVTNQLGTRKVTIYGFGHQK